MKKEDIIVVAQFLTGMKDSLTRLEQAQKNKDAESLNLIKREILNLQIQINNLL